MKISLSINPELEANRIVSFLKRTVKKTAIDRVVIGLSGGIDSATAFVLLTRVYKKENIYPAILNFYPKDNNPVKRMIHNADIPKENVLDMSIKPIVMEIEKRLIVDDHVRKGNLMARVRMITLFDRAKKVKGLVAGTENKSERLLGYYTRYGDAASDIEPITHLYKTQVYELAKYLKVPDEIRKAKPTAGLWDGQTDESELGFTYREADQVLSLYHDKKIRLEKIVKSGFRNAEKIVSRYLSNRFKMSVPYSL